MIETLLIANRGEIACRVIETARRMGVETVAVYSDVDAGARHVAMADRAVRIGGAAPGESYLRGDRIIMAALEAGADAVHPGYGFLSENAEFVAAVEAAGLIFVGPSAEAIRAMGLKDRAKALMAEAGVPVVPGYHGEDQEPGHLEVEAAEIGYPILIKAVAGGGGKGMRRVEGPEGFVDALESAKAEALGAFGNDAVLIEKYVAKPRHIEVQVFGDGARAVHLFERDCSLQRRHQKVIEEAPAPGMTREVRAAMCSAAVRAAEAVGYKGAGTVEFIVDASEGLRADRFWFMEMNTRLQVEHPVTEAITGVDLVEWQLRVAGGEGLPCDQVDLAISGHAIEARLYAEDTEAGFLPAVGNLEHLRFPDGVRVDTGVVEGDVISPFYDPMIAKVTVHGADRGAALRAMALALEGTEVAGTVTNVSFLARLLAHGDFQSGNVDTGIIDRDGAALAVPQPISEEARAIAAVTVLGLDADEMQGFSLWVPLSHFVGIGEDLVRVTPHAGGADVEVSGTVLRVACADGDWRVDGEKIGLRAVRVSDGVQVFGAGGGFAALADPLARGGDERRGAVLAPMPGRIVRVAVSAGDAVSEGDVLAVLEAMKMEHRLLAVRDGVVGEVRVRSGDQVEAGFELVRLEAEA
ncbi:MAG: biotin/lipoyl-binding protein [Boseongicola sp.]|nr:biotin/lipoyl-binding protein [Boseongicola sp.]